MKKLLLFALLLWVLLALSACDPFGGLWSDSTDAVTTAATTAPSTEPQDPYRDLIAAYARLIPCAKNATAPPSAEELGIDIPSYDALWQVLSQTLGQDELGYALRDLDGNGQDELILMSKSCYILGLFTVKDDVPHPLLVIKRKDGNTRKSAMLSATGTLTTLSETLAEYEGSLNSVDMKIEVLRVKNGELAGLAFGRRVDPATETAYYYRSEGGTETEITSTEYRALEEHHLFLHSIRLRTTKEAGLRFIPAVSEESDAPLADFSTYEDILALYRRVIALLPDFNESDWILGEYDGLYRFPDNESYEIFHAVLTAAWRTRPPDTYFGQGFFEGGEKAYGYALRDLDGDGQDELFLMTDDYSLGAIFTQKGGRVQLLTLRGNPDLFVKACSLVDKEGRLYAYLYTGGAVSRDHECHIYRLKDGVLVPELIVGAAVDIYLTTQDHYKIVNGERTAITVAEYEELYALCTPLPYLVTEAEYMKGEGILRFVPLYGSVAPTATTYHYYRQLTLTSTVEITPLTEDTLSLRMKYGRYAPGDETNFGLTVLYETVIEATATRREDGIYAFDNGTVRGTIEIGVRSIFVTLLESTVPEIECRTFCAENTD